MVAAKRVSKSDLFGVAINVDPWRQLLLQEGAQKISYYDGLRFAKAKDREQPLPPTAVVVI